MIRLPHSRDDEDILSLPKVPSIIAGHGAYIVDHIRRGNRDPDIGIISDFYRGEIDLGFHLRVILPYPLSHTLAARRILSFFLPFALTDFFLLPISP
jgi:hypothetical protein